MERITVAEVAQSLGIAEVTVRHMADNGLLPFMAPTNKKERGSNRACYVVFPHLYKLYVTGYSSPDEMAKELFLVGTAMAKERA